jgi:hypothetical protein
MTEVLTQIGAQDTVELVTDEGDHIEAASCEDAALLGRSLLACAATLCGPDKPKHRCADHKYPLSSGGRADNDLAPDRPTRGRGEDFLRASS